jgi:hypothetical protein
MKNNYKKILSVFVAVYFVWTATNIVFVLHLNKHNNGGSHNPENCPVCQQGLINKNPAVLHQFPKAHHSPEISFAVHYSNSSSKQIIEFQFPLLRAPPSVC